jgi:hypothetical protein
MTPIYEHTRFSLFLLQVISKKAIKNLSVLTTKIQSLCFDPVLSFLNK